MVFLYHPLYDRNIKRKDVFHYEKILLAFGLHCFLYSNFTRDTHSIDPCTTGGLPSIFKSGESNRLANACTDLLLRQIQLLPSLADIITKPIK